MRTDTALVPGQELEVREYAVTRDDLCRYAEAAGDHNPIHRDDRSARALGLPGVVAHGMYTMALAARALDEWAGGPGRVRELACRFARPVVVPADRPAVVTVAATVRRVDAEGVHLALRVDCAGQPVLAAARAVLSR
jgi:acyl dehydratase